jgi:hypothetical protein
LQEVDENYSLDAAETFPVFAKTLVDTGCFEKALASWLMPQGRLTSYPLDNTQCEKLNQQFRHMVHDLVENDRVTLGSWMQRPLVMLTWHTLLRVMRFFWERGFAYFLETSARLQQQHLVSQIAVLNHVCPIVDYCLCPICAVDPEDGKRWPQPCVFVEELSDRVMCALQDAGLASALSKQCIHSQQMNTGRAVWRLIDENSLGAFYKFVDRRGCQPLGLSWLYNEDTDAYSVDIPSSEDKEKWKPLFRLAATLPSVKGAETRFKQLMPTRVFVDATRCDPNLKDAIDKEDKRCEAKSNARKAVWNPYAWLNNVDYPLDKLDLNRLVDVRPLDVLNGLYSTLFDQIISLYVATAYAHSTRARPWTMAEMAPHGPAAFDVVCATYMRIRNIDGVCDHALASSIMPIEPVWYDDATFLRHIQWLLDHGALASVGDGCTIPRSMERIIDGAQFKLQTQLCEMFASRGFHVVYTRIANMQIDTINMLALTGLLPRTTEFWGRIRRVCMDKNLYAAMVNFERMLGAKIFSIHLMRANEVTNKTKNNTTEFLFTVRRQLNELMERQRQQHMKKSLLPPPEEKKTEEDNEQTEESDADEQLQIDADDKDHAMAAATAVQPFVPMVAAAAGKSRARKRSSMGKVSRSCG